LVRCIFGLYPDSDPTQKFAHDSAVQKTKKPWCFWAGTILDITQTRNTVGKYAAPTEIQVASSVLAATKWILNNPGKGIVWPEDLPHDFILDECSYYLGDVLFEEVDWKDVPETLQFVDFMNNDK
jgi:homospermidine synthase